MDGPLIHSVGQPLWIENECHLERVSEATPALTTITAPTRGLGNEFPERRSLCSAWSRWSPLDLGAASA